MMIVAVQLQDLAPAVINTQLYNCSTHNNTIMLCTFDTHPPSQHDTTCLLKALLLNNMFELNALEVACSLITSSVYFKAN